MLFQLLDKDGFPLAPARSCFFVAVDDKRKFRSLGYAGLYIRAFRSSCNN